MRTARSPRFSGARSYPASADDSSQSAMVRALMIQTSATQPVAVVSSIALDPETSEPKPHEHDLKLVEQRRMVDEDEGDQKSGKTDLRRGEGRAHRIGLRDRGGRERSQCHRRCHGRHDGKEDDEQMQAQFGHTNRLDTRAERDDDDEVGGARRKPHAQNDRGQRENDEHDEQGAVGELRHQQRQTPGENPDN